MVIMNIKRTISGQLTEYLRLFPATGLIGPRQVGKTTRARHIASKDDYLYRNMERQAGRERRGTFD